MSDESPNNNGSGFLSGRLPIIALAGVILVSLAAICGLGYSLLDSSNLSLPFGGDEPADPTPFPESVAGQPGNTGGSGAAANEAIVFGISDTETVSVTLDAPVNLRIVGSDFNVLPQTINADGEWSPGVSGDGVAGWVFGSIVNYILAVEPTTTNSTLLSSLAPGAELMLTMQSGARFLFEVEGSQTVPADDASIFSQLAPGVTLVLLGDSDGTFEVVNGRFISSESATGGGAGGVTQVGIGEPAQLDGLQVTVNNATFLPNHPDAPPGFAFLVLDGSLQNVGSTSVDVGNLQVVLVDEIGNQYVLNPVAGRLGSNPPLTGGFLASGQTLGFSAGYQLPLGLSSTTLTARIGRRDTGAQVQIGVPFSGSSAAQDAAISLQSVEVSEDLTSLILTGQITNGSSQPLIVAREDVTLRTPDGASFLILSSNPPFPWTVPAGQTVIYSVSFQRPQNADTAVFTILNQPYQLDGLR